MITIMFSPKPRHMMGVLVKLLLIYKLIEFSMSVLYLLVLVSIVVAAVFLIAFIWSVKNNQFEDQQGAAMRMLYDNELNKSDNKKS